MLSLAIAFHQKEVKNHLKMQILSSPLKWKQQTTQYTEYLATHLRCSLESIESGKKWQKLTVKSFCLSQCNLYKSSLGRDPSTQKNLMMKDSRFLSSICLSNDLLWENRTIDHRNTNHVGGFFEIAFQCGWNPISILNVFENIEGKKTPKTPTTKPSKHLGFKQKK